MSMNKLGLTQLEPHWLISSTKFVAQAVQKVALPMQLVHLGSQAKQLLPD